MMAYFGDTTEDSLKCRDNVCSICLEEVGASRARTPCRHSFHTECLRLWLRNNHSCPNCRIHIPN